LATSVRQAERGTFAPGSVLARGTSWLGQGAGRATRSGVQPGPCTDIRSGTTHQGGVGDLDACTPGRSLHNRPPARSLFSTISASRPTTATSKTPTPGAGGTCVAPGGWAGQGHRAGRPDDGPGRGVPSGGRGDVATPGRRPAGRRNLRARCGGWSSCRTLPRRLTREPGWGSCRGAWCCRWKTRWRRSSSAGAGRPAALGRRRHQVLVLRCAAARRRGGQHREAASGPASFLAVYNTAAGVLARAGGAAAPRWPCWISANRHRRVHRGQAGRRSGVFQPVARGDQQVHAGRDPGWPAWAGQSPHPPGHGHGERGGAGAGRCR